MQTLHENDTTLSISQLNNDNPNIRAALADAPLPAEPLISRNQL